MQIYAPAADASVLLATAKSLGLAVTCLARDAEADPDQPLILAFLPLDLRLAGSDLPSTGEELCLGYQHLLHRAVDPAASAGQRCWVVNLATCALPALLREVQHPGQALPNPAPGFARPPLDPLAALVALHLEQQYPGTLHACERLDQLAGAAPQALSYRQQLQQACTAPGVLQSWSSRLEQERQLQDQGHELDARLLELGSLPDDHDRLRRQLESQIQALDRHAEVERQRDHWQQRCQELDAVVVSQQRQLEQRAHQGRQQTELAQRWAEASQTLRRIQPRWLNS